VVLSETLSGNVRVGEAGKEGVAGLPSRKMLDKTMPLVHPVGAMAAAALCLPMHTSDGQITGLLPTEGAPQGAPEGRIQECFLHRDQKGGVIVHARPRRVFVVGAGVDRGYTVSAVQMVPAFDGCVDGLLDSHWWAPLVQQGNAGTVSHIEPASQDECLVP
jgi:hypothetical protein